MARIVFLTDHENSIGFRIAGADTAVVGSPEEAAELLTDALEKGEAGLIAVNEELWAGLEERLQHRAERSSAPIVVPIPTVRAVEAWEKEEEYIVKMIRRAIGYQLRIRR